MSVCNHTRRLRSQPVFMIRSVGWWPYNKRRPRPPPPPPPPENFGSVVTGFSQWCSSIEERQIFHGRRGRVSCWRSINETAVVWQNEERLPLPVGTLPVDSWPYLLIMSHFCNLAGKRYKRDQGFQATYEFLCARSKGKIDFGNVRCLENYCFAVHKGDGKG